MNRKSTLSLCLISTFLHCTSAQAMNRDIIAAPNKRRTNQLCDLTQSTVFQTDVFYSLSTSSSASDDHSPESLSPAKKAKKLTLLNTETQFTYNPFNAARENTNKLLENYENNSCSLKSPEKVELLNRIIRNHNGMLTMLISNNMQVATNKNIAIQNKQLTLKELKNNLEVLKKDLSKAQKSQKIVEKRKKLETGLKQQKQQLEKKYDFLIDIQYKDTLTKYLPIFTKIKSKKSNDNHIKSDIKDPVTIDLLKNEITQCDERIEKEEQKRADLLTSIINVKTEEEINQLLPQIPNTPAIVSQQELYSLPHNEVEHFTKLLEEKREMFRAVKTLNTQAIQEATIDTVGDKKTCKNFNQKEEEWIKALYFLHTNRENQTVRQAIETIDPQNNIENLQTHLAIKKELEILAELGKINPLLTPLTDTEHENRENLNTNIKKSLTTTADTLDSVQVIQQYKNIDTVFFRKQDQVIRDNYKQQIKNKMMHSKEEINNKIKQLLPDSNTKITLVEKVPSIGSENRPTLFDLSDKLEKFDGIVFEENEIKTKEKQDLPLKHINAYNHVLNNQIEANLTVLNENYSSDTKEEAYKRLQKIKENNLLNTNHNNNFNTWKQNNAWTYFKWTRDTKPLLSSWKSKLSSWFVRSFFSGW